MASWATERILLGSDESKDVAPNDSAEKFGVLVARMVEIGKNNEPKGFASGFLVAPNILITNHHVFSQPGDAINCLANFGYQRDKLSKAVQKDHSFALQPEEFFYSNKELDFSLVRVNAQGQWLTKGSDIVDPENTDESDIDWVANAGISISKIIAHLREAELPYHQKKFIDRVLGLSVDPLETGHVQPNEKNDHELGIRTTMETEAKKGALTMNFYGNTTVYVNAPDYGKGKAAEQDLATRLPGSEEKKETFDEDYSTRDGYDENFLDGFRVPLPTVAKERQQELLKKFGSRLPQGLRV